MARRLAALEGIAREVLALAGAPLTDPVDLRALLRALGLRPSRTAPSGCDGALQVSSGVLRVTAGKRAHLTRRRGAHELGHWSLALADSGLHGEDDADLVAMALVLPRAWVLEVLLRVGLENPTEVVAELGAYGAAWALVRAAWVVGRSAIVHVDGERLGLTVDDHETPAWGAWEQRAAREARRPMQAQRGLFGALALPFEAPGEGAGVLILPPELTRAVAERILSLTPAHSQRRGGGPMYIVTVETLAGARIRVTATLPGARWEEGSATAKTEAEARDLLEWLLGATLAPEARAELDATADEHRDAWIDAQEAARSADGFGAEQPEGAAEGECPDCLGLGRVIVRNDTNLGVGAPCDCGAGDLEPLTPEELDRAVTRDERRAYRGEVL